MERDKLESNTANGTLREPTNPVTEPAFVPGEVIVKFRDGIQANDVSTLQQSLGATTIDTTKSLDIQLWSVGRLSVENAIAISRNDPRIEYIEPNYIFTGSNLPNDPGIRSNSLWGLNNTGQAGGTPDADIDAPQAWNIQTGSDMVIGVIDGGVDYNHPDLVGNIWTNPGEIAGNGIDDDNNGYVDDIHGYDFVNNDADPMDDRGHGTHVAGTIAARANNGIGVAGVNWSAKIMALKWLDANGSGTAMNAIKAVEYATKMGVKLTNNSWHIDGFSQGLFDAIATAGAAGQLFIASAGNGGSDDIGDNNDLIPHYPSGYNLDNIISVASTDRYDNLARSSNFGATSVDLGAPGVSIVSTIPGGGYDFKSGTSMAAPHVTGVASLIWAQNPNLTAQQVKERILSSVDPIAALNGKTVTGGRLNAFKALLDPGKGAISGIKWNDLDVDGVKDNNEPNLANWTVFLDTNNNNLLDPGETSTTTDAGGIYTFFNLEPGNYTVAEVTKAGWLQTSPSTPGTHTVNLAANQVVENKDFGNRNASIGLIKGKKWNDKDEDGVKDIGEPGVDGWTIYIDENNNGVLDSIPLYKIVGSTDIPKTIPDLGTVTSSLDVSGLTSRLINMSVTLDISHTFDADLDVFLISPSGTRVELFTDIGGGGDNFTNTTLADVATTSITSGTAPFTGSFKPEGTLAALNGENPNGTWKLEVSDDSLADVGTLNSWSLTLISAAEPSTQTDAKGDYIFTGLKAGTYNVAEVQKDGWQQTFPSNKVQTVVLNSGEIAADIDFGNKALPGQIQGIKWNDQDGDGVQDATEMGLEDWIIFLDADSDRIRDPGENFTITGADGSYSFDNLEPGTYTVAEVSQKGWQQTYPLLGFNTVTVDPGATVKNVNFGNQKLPEISVNDATVTEGNFGTTTAVFNVKLSQASTKAVTVQYATADDTAKAGEDFTAISGTLTFAPGETIQKLFVPILGDTTIEPDETFFVNFTNATNAAIADPKVIATILNDDTLVGSPGNDSLVGTPSHDSINGGSGNDTIYGLGGHDTLDGGADQDSLIGGDGHDSLNGDIGNDSLYGENGSDTLDGGVGNDLLSGLADHDLLNGGDGNDTLFGGIGNDTLDGGAGNDSLLGGTGHDLLNGADGNDSLDGGSGHDTVIGGAGNDSLFGSNGNDELIGVNTSSATPGRNELDSLTGGAGADLFILGDSVKGAYYNDGNTSSSGTADFAVVTSFILSQDQIQLKGSSANYVLSVSGGNTDILLKESTNELIGRVIGVTALNLDNLNNFVYVV